MSDDQRIKKILPILKKLYPEAKCSLEYRDPEQLLVATILSAQCTDERVNKVTKTLFKKYRTMQDFAKAKLKVLEEDIRSVGFYHNKAKSILNCAKTLVRDHSGKVPRTMGEMIKLPGVGRKTANVVLGNAYGIASGIAVDTHVLRLSQRIGLSDQQEPVKVEKDLIAVVPRKEWVMFSHYLITHGRKICKALKPDCLNCKINKYCHFFSIK